MLDGVGGEVDLQGRGVRVGPVAVGTLVGLVLVVLALVRLWGAQRGQGPARAPPSPTPAWAPFAGGQAGKGQAGTHLEVGELSESLFAARMWALVGSVACVDSAMGSEVESLTDTVGRLQPPRPLDGLHHISDSQAALSPFHTLPREPQARAGDFTGTPFSFLLWPPIAGL